MSTRSNFVLIRSLHEVPKIIELTAYGQASKSRQKLMFVIAHYFDRQCFINVLFSCFGTVLDVAVGTWKSALLCESESCVYQLDSAP